MNKLNLFDFPRFPLSTETLEFMQQMTLLTAKLASLGGNSYILSGCTVTGSAVSAGVVVIDGEILPFVAGTVETYIVIEETNRSVTAESQVYANIYVSRACRFGTGSGQIAWSSLSRITDTGTCWAEIAAHIADHHTDWSNVDNKPAEYHPEAHRHNYTEIDNIPAGLILTGTVHVGDIAVDKIVTVTFADSIGTSNYIVTGSMRSTGNLWNDDNDVMWVVRDLTATGFSLLIHEVSSLIQYLYFDYVIITK